MKRFTLFLLIITSLFACKKQNDTLPEEPIEREIVLKKRDVNLPWNGESSNDVIEMSFDEIPLNNRQYLGYSFSFNSLHNIVLYSSYKILDIEKIMQHDKDLIKDIAVKNSVVEHCYSYSDYDRFLRASSFEDKVFEGDKMNLKYFSEVNKQFFCDSFYPSLEGRSKYTFGDINIYFNRNHRYIDDYERLSDLLNSNDYYAPMFKYNLYNYHPSQTVKSYGGFVICDYFSGGKVSAYLVGENIKGCKPGEYENKFQSELKQAYKVSDDKIELGRSQESENSTTKAFSNIQMIWKTVGGFQINQYIPMSVNDHSIDLSEWLEILENENTHQISYIPSNGLVPIAYLPQEKNLRDQLLKYTNDRQAPIKKIKEPYLEINYSIGGYVPSGAEIYTILNTRFGDKIKLRMHYLGLRTNPNFELIKKQAIEAELARVSQMFGLRIVQTNSISTRAAVEDGNMPDWNEFMSAKEMYNWFKEGNLYKIENNGEVFVYSDVRMPNGTRYAFSLRREQFLYDNGVKELVDRLPMAPDGFNVEYLFKNCTVFAL